MDKIQAFIAASKSVIRRTPDQDLAQDALLRAWERLDSFEGRNGAAMTTWIMGFVRRVKANNLRVTRSETEALCGYRVRAASAVPPSQEDAVFTRELVGRPEVAAAALAVMHAGPEALDRFALSRSRSAARRIALAA